MSYSNMKPIKERLGIAPPWEPLTSIGVGYPKGKIDGIVMRDNPPVDWFE